MKKISKPKKQKYNQFDTHFFENYNFLSSNYEDHEGYLIHCGPCFSLDVTKDGNWLEKFLFYLALIEDKLTEKLTPYLPTVDTFRPKNLRKKYVKSKFWAQKNFGKKTWTRENTVKRVGVVILFLVLQHFLKSLHLLEKVGLCVTNPHDSIWQPVCRIQLHKTVSDNNFDKMLNHQNQPQEIDETKTKSFLDQWVTKLANNPSFKSFAKILNIDISQYLVDSETEKKHIKIDKKTGTQNYLVEPPKDENGNVMESMDMARNGQDAFAILVNKKF